MLDKFKQLSQLRELQKSLKEEKVEVEDRGVKVVVNGNMEIEEIFLNESLSIEEQAIVLKKCINDSFKKIQLIAAQKMGMGGF